MPSLAGEPHGEGRYIWDSGSRYVGEYRYGLASVGVLYVTEAGREVIFYASQTQDGSWIVDHPQRQLDYP